MKTTVLEILPRAFKPLCCSGTDLAADRSIMGDGKNARKKLCLEEFLAHTAAADSVLVVRSWTLRSIRNGLESR
jgi:hypothetical protein